MEKPQAPEISQCFFTHLHASVISVALYWYSLVFFLCVVHLQYQLHTNISVVLAA